MIAVGFGKRCVSRDGRVQPGAEMGVWGSSAPLSATHSVLCDPGLLGLVPPPSGFEATVYGLSGLGSGGEIIGVVGRVVGRREDPEQAGSRTYLSARCALTIGGPLSPSAANRLEDARLWFEPGPLDTSLPTLGEPERHPAARATGDAATCLVWVLSGVPVHLVNAEPDEAMGLVLGVWCLLPPRARAAFRWAIGVDSTSSGGFHVAAVSTPGERAATFDLREGRWQDPIAGQGTFGNAVGRMALRALYGGVGGSLVLRSGEEANPDFRYEVPSLMRPDRTQSEGVTAPSLRGIGEAGVEHVRLKYTIEYLRGGEIEGGVIPTIGIFESESAVEVVATELSAALQRQDVRERAEGFAFTALSGRWGRKVREVLGKTQRGAAVVNLAEDVLSFEAIEAAALLDYAAPASGRLHRHLDGSLGRDARAHARLARVGGAAYQRWKTRGPTVRPRVSGAEDQERKKERHESSGVEQEIREGRRAEEEVRSPKLPAWELRDRAPEPTRRRGLVAVLLRILRDSSVLLLITISFAFGVLVTLVAVQIAMR